MAFAGTGVESVCCESESFLFRQGDGDFDRMAAFAPVGVTYGHTGEVGLGRVVDILLLDAEELKLILVDGDAKPFGGRVEAVVHVNDKGNALENFPELRRGCASRLGSGP